MLHRLLHKVLQLYLISWGGNFVERHSFHIVLSDSPETMRKLCLSVFYAVFLKTFDLHFNLYHIKGVYIPLREKCPYSEIIWPVFSRI